MPSWNHGSTESPIGGVLMYDETLAATGVGGIVIGSVFVDIWWVALIGIGLMAAGVVAARLFRRRADTNR